MTEKQLREKLRKVIQQEYQDYRMEESITGWLIDKVASGFKWYANKKADYQYDALLGSKEFRSMASKFGMSERDWDKKARDLIRRDPKKFADMLAYDYKTQSYRSKGYKI